MFFFLKLLFVMVLIDWLPVLGAQVKETHQIIEEWVETQQLISEEKSNWDSEKASLNDLEYALTQEIAELEKKLLQFEEENVGAAKQRANLSERKERAQGASVKFYESMQAVEKEVQGIIDLMPTPLRDRVSMFLEKIDSQGTNSLPLRKRLDASVALLQNIHLFHRNVHLERQEFSLNDGQSREFRVIYFGLGVAYFVNESSTVAGWGRPTEKGWKWTRQDELANEISIGVAIMSKRALPRFLELPLPLPAESK